MAMRPQFAITTAVAMRLRYVTTITSAGTGIATTIVTTIVITDHQEDDGRYR